MGETYMKKGKKLMLKSKKTEIGDATPKEVKDLLEKALAERDLPVYIFYGWCKRCGICIEFCPHKVYEKGEDGYPVIAHPNQCTSCYMCEYRCPDFAITVLRSRK